MNSKARKPQIKVRCLRPPERLGGGQMVARRTVSLAGLLGLGLAGVLAVVSDPLPQLFNPSQGVMAAIRPIYPFVVLTQPLNALAFVWDGVLYGTGGFPYAATVRAASPQAGRKWSTAWQPAGQQGPLGRLCAVVACTLCCITQLACMTRQRRPHALRPAWGCAGAAHWLPIDGPPGSVGAHASVAFWALPACC